MVRGDVASASLLGDAGTARGNTVWADAMAAIIADTSNDFYYGSDNDWRALNLGGAIRALVGTGYGRVYQDGVTAMLSDLISMIDADGSIGGWVQDTAYAVPAFNSVGRDSRAYANDLGRWLATQQTADGGWLEAGDEYPEVDGEALRALASTIGRHHMTGGFAYGQMGSHSWKHRANAPAVAFTG
ncbi:MAG: hypothetical protein GWP04_04600 [Gammaproteobacteria bacterium]|nr:hypothetical protein [Gammaproteobacteria bacterium]